MIHYALNYMTLCLKNNNNKIAIHKIIVVLSSHRRLTQVYPRKGSLKNKTKTHLHSRTKTWNHVLQLHIMWFFFITLTIKPLTPLLKYEWSYKP